MQKLHPDILKEIVRRTGMRNRAALEATSRTTRDVARSVTDETTRRTREGMCRGLKIAFGIRQAIRKFADQKAIDAYISTAKARARPGEGAELVSRIEMDAFETTSYVTDLFVGYVNGARVHVDAVVRPHAIDLSARLMRPGSGNAQTQNVYVTKEGVIVRGIAYANFAATAREVEAYLKREMRQMKRGNVEARTQRSHLKEMLQRVKRNSALPQTIDVKVVSRAIEACATSLRAAMW
jgi:hypothetical protein